MSNYYVSGCVSDGDNVSICDDIVAQFWTLYHRNEEGLSQGIIDCMFREDAETAMRAYEERDALAANEGYKQAFYEIAGILGICARPDSPKDVFEQVIKPMLINLTKESGQLAAENVALKSAISYVCDTDNQPDYQYEGMGCGIEGRGIIDRYEAARYGWDEALERIYSEVISFAEDTDTPATEAYLNAVRADGADAVAAYHKERADALLDVDRRGANEHKVSYMAARDVAAQLRAGEPS